MAEFPYTVWRTVSSAAGEGCVAFGGSFIFCAEADRLNVYCLNDAAATIGGDKVVATLGRGEKVSKDRFDSQGFASVVYDDVIQVSTSTHADVLYVMSLHRSGTVNVWRFVEQDEEGQYKFSPVASWVFTCRTGAPRFMEAHSVLPVVAVTSSTGRTRIYDYTTGTMTHHFENMLQAGDMASCLKLHSTRGLVLVGSELGWAIVCDLWRKAIVSSHQAHTSVVTDAAFIDINLDSTAKPSMIPCFITMGHDRHMRLWSLQDFSSIANQKMMKRLIKSGVRALTCTAVIEIGRPLDPQESSEDFIVGKHDDAPGVKQLVVVKLREEAVSMAVVTKASVEAVLVDVKHSLPPWFVVAASESGSLKLYDMVNGKLVKYSGEEADPPFNFVIPRPAIRKIHRQNNFLVVVSVTGGLIWWPLHQSTLKPQKCFRGVGSACTAAVIKPLEDEEKSRLNVYTCSVEGEIVKEFVDWSEGGTCEVRTMSVHDDSAIGSIDLSHCGSYMAFATKLGRLCVVDLDVKKCILSVEQGTVGPLTKVAFSAKPIDKAATTLEAGKAFVVSIGTDNFARVWPLNFIDGESEQNSSTMMWKTSDKPVYCVTVSKNNAIICTGGADKCIKVWRTATGEKLETLKGHKSSVTALAYHPSEPILASAAADGTIRVWQMNKYECIDTVAGMSSNCLVLKYTSDGSKLVGGCADGSLHTWSMVKGKLQHLGSFLGHDEEISAISETMFAGRTSIVSVAGDGSLVLWRDESTVLEEKRTAKAREEKQDLAKIDMWINQKDFASAIRAACRWRKVEVFERVIQGLLTLDEVNFQLGELIREHFTSKDDLEMLLLTAVHFCKRRHTLYIAHWICQGLLSGANILELRQIDGFSEFSRAFSAKTASLINRWERLNEKSFLLSLVSQEGDTAI